VELDRMFGDVARVSGNRRPQDGAPAAAAKPPATPKGPAVGTVQDGYRFKGGNPADKTAWEKV